MGDGGVAVGEGYWGVCEGVQLCGFKGPCLRMCVIGVACGSGGCSEREVCVKLGVEVSKGVVQTVRE